MIDFSRIKIISSDESHRDFLFQLKKAAMGPYVAQIWGWDEKHQQAMFAQDWRREPHPQVILYDDKPIGSILVTRESSYIHIGRFYLLPEYQNQGIGTHILENELKKADRAKKSVNLAVLKINPAIELYRRHGFRVNGMNEHQYLMERKPGGKIKKYQAVIFDLFGTLVENYPAQKSFENLSRMADIVGVPAADFATEWRNDIVARMNGTTKNYQACIKNICQRLGAHPTDKKIDKAASVRFILNQQEVMTSKPGAIEVLSYLKANGYKTALLSNCSMETTTIWPKTELAPLIDVPVMSSIEGIMKPDLRLFQIVLKKLAVKPEDCLYVADGVGQELTTAAKLGMTAVLVEVPHDSEYEHDRETWEGLKINSLKEVLNLVK